MVAGFKQDKEAVKLHQNAPQNCVVGKCRLCEICLWKPPFGVWVFKCIKIKILLLKEVSQRNNFYFQQNGQTKQMLQDF